MQTKTYATERDTTRAAARAKRYSGETGAKRLAEKLGCGVVAIYEWEKVGRDHLPKNRILRKAYLKAIGLTEDQVSS